MIGAFSWNPVQGAYWLASAFWYCSLILSVLGLLLSAQQTVVLNLLGEPRKYTSSRAAVADIRRYLPMILTEISPRDSEPDAHVNEHGIGVWKLRNKMIFTWQCPVMFMSYSVCLFLAGLTLLVCTPLIRRDDWSSESNVRTRYILPAFARPYG